MKPGKDHRPEPGSLEASLRELNAQPTEEDVAPRHAEAPTDARPGEHTAATPRAFDMPTPVPGGYTLWGRCGFVPSSRLGR